MMELKGRHAFVTGAGNGIGLAIAQRLADEGGVVTLTDIDTDALRQAVESRPGAFLSVSLDTRDRDGWRSAKAAAEGRFGDVDILVNNAGIGPDGREFADMDPGAFDRMIAINLTGVFNGVSAFAGDMRARGRGHIVNTASMAGLIPNPSLGAYTAAKFGVVGLSETLRSELAPHGVGVSVLCPGLVETRLRETTLRAGSEVVQSREGAAPRTGLDAAFVAGRVIEAIRLNTPYILTHGEHAGLVERRLKRLSNAFAATPPSTQA